MLTMLWMRYVLKLFLRGGWNQELHHDMATSRLLSGAVLRLKVHMFFSVSSLPFEAYTKHAIAA